MASIRAINCIPFKRLVTVYGLSNARIVSHIDLNLHQSASYSTKKLTKSNAEQENRVQLSVAEVVRENTKSLGYLGVIIGGIGIAGLMLYVIFNEIFSSKSPNNVYSKALERCVKHPKVIDALGEPIRGYRSESRRRRMSNVRHVLFKKDGVQHMRMQFYIQGIRRRGTVDLEVQEDASGNYVYTYLHVLVDDLFQTVINVEDNTGIHNDPNITPDFDLRYTPQVL